MPLPSYVEVTNLENDKKVILRVNDRGPFVKDRILDVSEGAADILDFTDKGTARVRVRILTEKSREAEIAIKNLNQHKPRSNVKVIDKDYLPKVSQEGLFYIQVGAFQQRSLAQKLNTYLYELGFSAKKIHLDEVSVGYDKLFRSRLGPFSNQDNAWQLRDRLHEEGFLDSYVIIQ